MKKVFLLFAIFALSMSGFAQPGKAKGKHKNKSAEHSRKNNDHDVFWPSTEGNSGKGKGYKNPPKKVEASLLRDYPGARNVSWSKYRGDYTATFNNGIWRSTAVYHANGDRRDTRTILTRRDLPGTTIWDKIFKRDRITPIGYVQIERPSVAERIFRILASDHTAYFYDESGNRVEYNY